MELKHLATFVAVARHLNFTRAARELGYVQSSVTAHIKALETDIGVPLFERLGRRVVLTPAGEELLEHAQYLVSYADEVQQAVREAAGDPHLISATLRIGAPESLCAYRLPPVLRALQVQFPRMRIIFGAADRTSLLTALSEGTADAGFLIEESVTAPAITAERITKERMLLVAEPGHHLAGRDAVRTSELASETLLLMERGCAQRDVIEAELKRSGIEPPSIEFVSIEALKRNAAAGLGVAMLPAVTADDDVERGDLTVLPWAVQPRLGVFFVQHKDRRRTTATSALAALARDYWTGLWSPARRWNGI